MEENKEENKIDVVVVSKDVKFWQNEISVLKQMISSIEQEMEHGKKIISVHMASLKHCENELKRALRKG